MAVWLAGWWQEVSLILFGLRQREMKAAKESGGAWISNSRGECVGRCHKGIDGRRTTVASPLLPAQEEHEIKPRQAAPDGRICCATSEKWKPHTLNAGRNSSHPKTVGTSSLFIMYSIGRGTARNTLLHSHFHPRPPSQAISFQTLGFEATRQKSKDCLVSGDRETQGTESIVTQAWEEIFSQDMWLFSGPQWSRVSHHTKEIKSLFSNYKCHLISIIYIS